ncbi:protein EXECUTER 2, chloroplastic isoform X1 [Selaginella moellendorffii]|uniref:protein EXECUTER 2, chloroplastic isoform X1 n=1 Tax=Selaginella moellendorffii TaxID=88036 RepID=UPI000D1C7D14|nr:protein EXECUTER 2, chloroplastic isoform X1 [Selaginella moellendorffii]|eukprot:XP_024528327.1 protein EXECUTER 2, chloroplastic isoform X1 [Selaginella moellendorffii]
MAAALVSQAAAGLASRSSSSSSLGGIGGSSNLLACSSSRQHFQFPVSAWTSAGNVVRVSSRLRGVIRCQCRAVDDNSEDNAEISGTDERVLRIKSVSSRKLEEYIASSSGSSSSSSSPEDKEWKSWQEHFPKVEEEDNLISALKFQLEEAVKLENFQEAAKLKRAIEAAKANDVISEVNKELQRALQEERYKDAARLRDEAGAGLVGWWAGISKDGSDPFGRIIRVRAAHGRLIAQNYTARQLATFAQKNGAEGDALFEVFVKKEDNGFNKQVVYLQHPAEAEAADLDKLVDIDIDEIVQQAENESTEEKNRTKSAGKTEKQENEKADDDSDEAHVQASGIVDFLKDRIPDLNMKVIKVIAPEGSEPDIPKIIEEIIEREQKEHRDKSDASAIGGIVVQESSDTEGKAGDDQVPDDKAVTIRVVIGGASPGEGGDGSTGPAVRVPATIKQESIDSFVLHIDSIPDDIHQDDSKAWKVARIATKASADQMPDDVAQKLWNVEKVPVQLQVSKELKEVIKLAVNQAQKMQSLPKTTVFHRIDVTESSDPFTGLYVGAFGANTPEILQLKRKYGHWDTKRSVPDDKLKFYEYVEAIKLTGDLNVPAGQVSFRARIAKENRMSPLGIYPEELGVIARYRGQGQLADPGFKHPKWTDGELVLLDGRTTGPTNGARLGFVFYLPDHHFLILFDRLNLEKLS